MDDITAFMSGRNKEFVEIAQKVLKKLKREIKVEEQRLKLSITEDGKQGKGKVPTSCKYFEGRFQERSKKGDLEDENQTVGSKGEGIVMRCLRLQVTVVHKAVTFLVEKERVPGVAVATSHHRGAGRHVYTVSVMFTLRHTVKLHILHDNGRYTKHVLPWVSVLDVLVVLLCPSFFRCANSFHARLVRLIPWLKAQVISKMLIRPSVFHACVWVILLTP